MTDPTVHLDLDGLADHLAGELDAGAHLSGCGGCTARLAELEAADRLVVLALQGLADPPLPDEVADRISAGLADQALLTPAAPPPPAVVPLAARRRRPTWLPAVAAGVVLVTGGLLGAQLLGGRDGSSSGTQTAPQSAAGAVQDSAAPAFATVASGLDYADAAAVTAALPAVLDGSADAPAAREAEALVAGPLARLREPAALADCLGVLPDPSLPDQRPLALDYATYGGAPALAVVLPDPDPTRLSLFVVGPGCSRADADVRFFTRVTRP